MDSSKQAKKSNESDHLFKQDFQYKHENPYHHRLEAFDQFVLRDTEGENFCGKWSKEVFKNDHDLALEIGSGFGHFMLDFTQKNPNLNYIGMDHRFKRSFQLAKKLSKLEHQNFRYLRARGERTSYLFEDSELSKIFYFFPDPWPKTRHHKKRLFQKSFLDQAHKVLKNEGIFYIKTDHLEYFEWMLKEMTNENRFKVLFKSFDLYQDKPEHFLASFQTKFEKMFLEKKIPIKAMVLQNIKV